MNKMFNGTERLQLFGLEIIALISQGKSETIEQIEQHIDAGNLIQYIREKYKDNMFNTFDDDCPYNLEDWNQAFAGYSEYIQGNERSKFGIYNDYGMHKDKLEDLIMFYSSGDKKLITLDEYVNKLKEEDKNIYYCAGETVDKIDMLPQVEGIKDKHEVLYLTDYIDEFAIMAIHEYKGKTFVNVTNESTDLSTDEEKEKINKENTDNKDMLEEMKKVLEGNVEEVKLTNKLKSHPVCLTTTGEVSTSMEKVINAMPTDEKIKANEVLEINASHKIVDKLKDLYKNDKDEFTKYTKVIYYEARLIEGLPIDNPTELSNLMCDIMANK